VKILRLRLAGFGPFRLEQHVDFGEFDDDGLFLISGRTGSGKSSILDAVCYALYGRVPRYDGAAAGSVRSHHCAPDDETFVELDFRVGSAEYRIRRTCDYERPKKRGGGMTQVKAEVLLSRRLGEVWEGVAAKAREVELELLELLPVTAEQFRQIILLAQNRFAEFLHASTAQRRELLQKLFGTHRFDELEKQLADRAKTLRESVTAGRAQLMQLADAVAAQSGADLDHPVPDAEWFTDARVAGATALLNAEMELESATAAASAAHDALRAGDAVRALQLRRRAAADLLPSLEAAEEGVTALRIAVAASRRAEPVWPRITDAVAALRAAGDAQHGADSAAAAWVLLTGAAEADPSEIAASLDERQARLGALDEPVAAERELPRLRASAEGAAADVEAHDVAVRVANARAAELPALVAAIDTGLPALVSEAATAADVQRDLDRIEAALTSAREAEGLSGQVIEARRRQMEANTAVADALAVQRALVARRLGDQAGVLAKRLVPGEPCAVCGSVEHPAPAALTHDAVDDDALDAAQAEYDRCDVLFRDVGAVVDRLAVEEQRARAGAGGRSVDDLEAERDLVVVRADGCRAAATRAEELTAARTALLAELAGVEEGLHAARQEREILVAGREATRAALDGAAARVAAAADGHATVADRVARLREELAAARSVAAADAALAAATARAEDAASALASALEEHGFSDDRDVRAARLTAADLAAHETLIRAHDEELAVVRGTLAAPELAGLPEQLVATDQLSAAAEHAAEERDRLGRSVAVLGERAAAVDAAAAEAVRMLADSDSLIAEAERIGALASAVQGKEPNTRRIRLETYVLAARLEEIIAAANRRLTRMTGSRYTLQLDDERQHRNLETGLGLRILDEHTGQSRATASLSGGETFLASLALALGLAEVVSEQAGGVRLDTLFVDEGFGSLDGETLEAAMEALDALRAGGRTVGVISHVESMKEEIPAKLEVRITPRGDSVVGARAASAVVTLSD